MTNNLVGDVYQKIIEEVIGSSKESFEEHGIGQDTLLELQKEWQNKLSQRGVAQMPWDPKPAQQSPPVAAPAPPSSAANGLPSSSYQGYDQSQPNSAANGPRIKTEPGTEPQYNGIPNGYPQQQQPAAPTQGGLARAQQLVHQQYGSAANASINAMQRGGGGLALPGQPQQAQQARPGLQLPGQNHPQNQAQYSPQQQQQAAMHRHQQQLQQQQNQPQIKVEGGSPQMPQARYPQQAAQPNYSQTDGADDAMERWQDMLAQRRALNAQHAKQADHMMRDHVMNMSAELQSGLMVPLDEQPSNKRLKHTANAATSQSDAVPQFDGVGDDNDDVKPDIKEDLKDEDDENAINSDLDDSDDEKRDELGEDDDDGGDTILCTYDKVQRVKNKWKCTLKDGVMSVGGKEWVFHKGQGEFEW